MSAQAQQVTLGDQVRLRFLGWPETVSRQIQRRDGSIEITDNIPHPRLGQPWVATWNSRPYTLYTNQDVYVPFEMAKLYFGDPRSVTDVYRIKDEHGNDMIIPDRVAEVKRLRHFWGSSVTQFREYIPGDLSFINEPISDMMPRVEVYSLAGERILMVMDDPAGNTVMVENRTRADESRSQHMMMQQSEAIIQLQKQNKLLLAKLGIREEDLSSLNNPEIKKVAPVSQPGSLVTPNEATVEERPSMVFNPRTRRVEPVRTPPTTNPTVITEIPTDLDD